MIRRFILGVAILGLAFCQVAIKGRTNSKNKTPWNLPILPPNFFDETIVYSNQYSKIIPLNKTAPTRLIPRILWISFRKVPTKDADLHPHIKELLQRSRAEGWTVHLVGEKEQLDFLAKYFPGTSLLWAANAVHADAGVCQSDIWRYAALYKFGGVYLDDDSFIGKSLERDCIRADDQMILTIEKNKFANHCYRRAFYLNHDHLFRSEGDHFDYSSVHFIIYYTYIHIRPAYLT